MKARDNPLAVCHLHALSYRFLEGSWSAFHEKRKMLNNRGAVIGPKGSGKTTLLLELEKQLSEAGWRVRMLRLNREHQAAEKKSCLATVESPGPQDFILLDGAEQLSVLSWRRFIRHSAGAGGLIITAHRPGRLPLLHRTATSPELLSELLQELVPDAAWNPGRIRAIYEQHAGNIREAFFEVYDGYAGVKKAAADGTSALQISI